MSEQVGTWRRFLARLRGQSAAALPAPPKPEETAEPEPAVLGTQDESWLGQLATDVGEGARLSEVGDATFWGHIGALWDRGDELLAAQWVEKLIDAPATPPRLAAALRARLVEMFDERGDLKPALAHLEALTRVERHATRAHYLLAEHHRRRGEEVAALRHYEAVLARDVDYPNVRARVMRLRAARGVSSAASQGETLVGAEALGASAGSRYLLVRELGRGASGVVYLARDRELERDVAVKLLHPHLAAAHRADACARFFAEARLAASLRHPNIVAILDLDERARRIVMELCGGGTLRRVLRERGPRNLRRALERHTQILSALAAAHARGVVHRDLKPANLMFRRDPDDRGAEVVLGDFGVAHLPDARGQDSATRSASHRIVDRRDAVGTLAYMAPEARRGLAEARSDLFASAVVLFEMLTGSYPWPRDQLLAGVRRRGDFTLPADIASRQPDLARRLQAHLSRLGDPDAASRPDTDEALREAQSLRDEALLAGGDTPRPLDA